MTRLEKHWYRSSLTVLTILLLPLSWLFRFICFVRYYLYYWTLIKTIHFPVPVIIVGNITVGGTGKTPLIIWLAHFLKKQGLNPGIVTRGVGGKKQLIPVSVTINDDPAIVGDEAILLAKRHYPVVIGVDRVAAVRTLLATTRCDIVLSDDGLQHYRLGRDIEIALVDGDRRFGNQRLLPAGPLRESVSCLNKVDFVVQQGTHRNGEFLMQLRGDSLISLVDEQLKMPLSSLSAQTCHAIAGIGNPSRFFAMLRQSGLHIIEHVFPDHYHYQATDFNFSDPFPIIMTEKDAVKCKRFSDDRFWYLPVDANLDNEFQKAFLIKLAKITGIKTCVLLA